MVNNQSDTLYQINRSVYSLLRYGRQGVKDASGHRRTVHYIDWEDIDNNDFFVAEEVSVLRFDGVTHYRPDVVLYINGIALGVFELKRSCVSAGKGIRQHLDNQKQENILNFYSTAQLLFAGNEAEGLSYGTINTPEKYYLKWKEDQKATDDLSAKVKLLQVKETNRLRDGVVSLCQKERFLSLIHDFVIYDAGIKKAARHNQYFANIAARKRIQDGEGGIIWNTQGSGKSLIVFDMSLKPRLKDDRGTAMLVAGSIYEACKYWEIFMSMGFTKCAIVTSYEPTTQSVRTTTTDLSQESEEEYKKKIYEQMLGGKKLAEFEKEVKEQFKDAPAQMKLLIVVDKLLTGFDAPSATYLYI